MKDSVLALVDMRAGEAKRMLGLANNLEEPPHTIEGALLQGEEPLLDLSSVSDADKAVHMRRICKLAREYLVDYDLARAAARCGLPWYLVRTAERDPFFVTLVQQMSEELKPEEIVTRAEVMNMLKREACTAAKSRDRVAAMKVLANIAGFTEADGGERAGGGAPTINITLNTGNPEKPAIEVGAKELL